MNEENSSLVIFTKAALMLAEADTVQKCNELKSIALTAMDWAKHYNKGKEAIQYARSYALEAERKMGEMLKVTERAKGGNPKLSTSNLMLPVAPTLKEYGLSKQQSVSAQFLADIPKEKFNELKKGAKLTDIKKSLRHDEILKERKELADKAINIKPNDRWQVDVGDLKSYKFDKQFDFIITDPPYPLEYLPLYETLGYCCEQYLKPNGLLICMCGQSYLDKIYKILSEHLDYYWTGCYFTPGQPTPLRQKQVNTNWKPLLIFQRIGSNYKGKIFGDVFKSDDNDKTFHKWGQSLSGMESIIKMVCLPGQTILDPFCGAGTTLIAGLRHGCLVTGIDINEECVNITKGRISGGILC